MFVPTFLQLDDNVSVVRMAGALSEGYLPSPEEAEIAWAAICWALTKFFIKVFDEPTLTPRSPGAKLEGT